VITRLLRGRAPAVALLAAAGALACARDARDARARHVPRTHRVEIKNFVLGPASLVVAPGDTVEWVNTDFVPHTATARDSTFDSKSIDGGGSWRVVVRAPGRHPYYCVFHPTMQATVEVR
jgi:plastocyanin